jgi:hypothetical protein
MAGVAPTTTGQGYWLVARDGGVFSFGDAPFLGSMVAARPVNVTRVTRPSVYGQGGRGYDVSWPQCNQALPRPGSFTVLGVTGGKAFTHNPCLGALAGWGRGTPISVYVNVNGLPGAVPAALEGPAGSCGGGDLRCQAYNYGYHDVTDALAYARSQGVDPAMWWLDVETMNSWSADRSLNARVIDGALDALAASGKIGGVYSTAYQWGVIAGGYSPGVPVWVAGGGTGSAAPNYCAVETAFAGGTPWLVQYLAGGFDGNFAC